MTGEKNTYDGWSNSGWKTAAVEYREEMQRQPRKSGNGADYRETGTARRLISRRASDITPKDIRFVWNGRLALGKHTCIGGEPGGGKSQLTINVAAMITTAGLWPCGEGRAPLGNVIILNAEDDEDDTI